MIALLACVILLVGASVLLGRTILAWVGAADRGSAPAVGFAALVVLSDFVMQIGGRGWEAALVAGATIAGSAAGIGRSGGRRPSKQAVAAVAAGGLTLVGGLIPFWANHRVGILGVSIDNDLAIHQYWAWARQVGADYPGLIGPGYPLGAHSLAAALASAAATTTERSFAALLVGVPVLTAVTAHALLDHLRAPLRLVASVLVALPYLAAAYLAEGSFKEPMVVLLLLGCVAVLRRLDAADPRPGGQRWGRGGAAAEAVPLGVITGASVLIEGKPGLAWPIATIALWGLLRLGSTLVRRRLGARQIVSRLWPPVVLGVGVLTVAAAPELNRITAFSPSLLGSNLPYPLPVTEALGVWINGDFRLAQSALGPDFLAIAGGALFLYAAVWHLRRGEVALIAAPVAAAAVYLYVRAQGSTYLSAKTLMVLSPPYMAVVLGAVLSLRPPSARTSGGVRPGPPGANPRRPAAAIVVSGFVAAAFTLAAAYSSSLVLRGAVVNSDAHMNELAGLRRIASGQPVLFLVPDDFAAWKIRGTRAAFASDYGIQAQVPLALNAVLVGTSTAPAFDTVDAASLDRFTYVVTTRSTAGPTPPPNWQLAMMTNSYAMWKRAGATPAVVPLAPKDPGGAVLDCRVAVDRALVHRSRVADVRPPAVTAPAAAWRLLGGAPLPVSPVGFAAVPSGSTISQTIVLPAGEWEISLAYVTAVDVRVTVGSLSAILPANLDTFGPYWSAGRTRGGGPVVVSIRLDPRRFPASPIAGAIGPVVATRADLPPRLVPVQAACGQVVDWLAD